MGPHHVGGDQAQVEGAGGKIIDNLLVPQNTRDFTAYLLKIQQAKPDVVATAVGGDDIKALARAGRPAQARRQAGLDQQPAGLAGCVGAPDSLFGVFGTTWYHKLPLPGVADFVKKWQAANKDGPIPVPGNVSYNGYMATRELLRAIERAGSTNNVKIIKELENLKVSATDRMQHFDAYMDPATHQMQQTIYLARRNAKPADNTDLFEIISWTEPKAAADDRCRKPEVQADALRAGADRSTPLTTTAAVHLLQPGRVRSRPGCLANSNTRLPACSIYFRISSTASTLGLLFALIALGFMLIVRLMEQINLAHGSLFALGAYFAMQLMGPRPPFPAEIAHAWLALPLGWRYAATLIMAPAAVGVVGIAIEFCMRRTYGKDPLYGLLLTFGAAMVIEESDPPDLGHARLRVAGAAGV